jgi:hypothetical protein
LLSNNYQGETPYNYDPWSRRTLITLKPTWEMEQATSMGATALVDAWMLLQGVGRADSHAYKYDLVDVGRQVMANLFLDLYMLSKAAYGRKDLIAFEGLSANILKLISDWDKLLSTHESYLLGRWIAGARSWAADDTEADLFDFNARNQVTLWGYNGEIDDYASKNWGGLARGYYLKRWQLLLSNTHSALEKNVTLDMDAYSAAELSLGQNFCVAYSDVYGVEAVGDTLEVSKDLMTRYGNTYQAPHSYLVYPDTDVQGDNVDIVSTPTWTRNLKQLQYLCDVEFNCVGFTSEGLLKRNADTRVSSVGVNLYLKSKCVQGKC